MIEVLVQVTTREAPRVPALTLRVPPPIGVRDLQTPRKGILVKAEAALTKGPSESLTDALLGRSSWI
jgi:hypothetical protein